MKNNTISDAIKERRYAQFVVTDAVMVDWIFNKGGKEIYEVDHDLPEDAQFCGSYHDAERGAFLFRFAHMSFDRVGEAQIIPTYECRVFEPATR